LSRFLVADIDLLFLLEEQATADRLVEKKYTILSEFKKILGDRKIDFSILSRDAASLDPFYSNILKSSISLKKWH
jgi:hypothetical protein